MGYTLSRISRLWSADKFGYPWREVFSEVLFAGQQVVCVVSEDGDPSVEALKRWAQVEPNLVVLPFEPVTDAYQQRDMVNAAVDASSGEFIHLLDSDELVEMDCLMPWLAQAKDELLASPLAVTFRRWDFTYNARFITDQCVPDTQMVSPDLIAREWYPSEFWVSGGAGHFENAHEHKRRLCPCINWHYTGLLSEHGQAKKQLGTRELHRNYAPAGAAFPPPSLVATSPWDRFFESVQPPARPLSCSHPKIMWPWLSRAEMFWRPREP